MYGADRPITQESAAMDSSPAATDGSPSLPRLFASFLRLGTTAFGGPAMVAYIRKMAVERNQWLDDATFQDGVALCQTAAYVGLRSRGLPGAAVCFVGFGLPAFCFMAILSAFCARTHDLPLVLGTFQGLRAITVAINVLSLWWARRKAMHSFDSGVPVCRSSARYCSMGDGSGRVPIMYLPAGMKPSRQSTVRRKRGQSHLSASTSQERAPFPFAALPLFTFQTQRPCPVPPRSPASDCTWRFARCGRPNRS